MYLGVLALPTFKMVKKRHRRASMDYANNSKVVEQRLVMDIVYILRPGGGVSRGVKPP